MGFPLEQTYDDYPVVLRYSKQERRVWGRLVKIMQRGGVDTKLVAMLYRAIVQLVLFFGLESWLLLTAMERMVEGIHTGYL